MKENSHEKKALLQKGCDTYIQLCHMTDFETALYEMLRNEEVVKVLEFCRRRATYYYLKLKILK